MRRTVFIVLLFILISPLLQAQKKKSRKENKNTRTWHYDLDCAGVGKQGAKLVKVWSYTDKPRGMLYNAQKNAVHGLVFKGYSGEIGNCSSFLPLVTDTESIDAHKQFFKQFFRDGGDYLKYVSSATDGKVAPGDIQKIGKKQYKVGMVVAVQVELLRRRLEKEGVIRGLSTGF